MNKQPTTVVQLWIILATSMISKMHPLRLGLGLIIIGLALPLICLPLLIGYQQNASWFANIQQMSLPITQDNKEPEFRKISSLRSHEENIRVRYGKTGMTLEFPGYMTKDEMTAAIKAEQSFQNEQDLPDFMRFYGWKVVHHGVSIPFSYIMSFCILLIFAGAIVLVYRATEVRHWANIQKPQPNFVSGTNASVMSPRLFPKADLGARFAASVIDGFIGGVLLFGGALAPAIFQASAKPGSRLDLTSSDWAWYLYIWVPLLLFWILGKDAIWPGQSLGKRYSKVIIHVPRMSLRANRLRCVWRQFIYFLFFFALFAIVGLTGGPKSIGQILACSFVLLECILVIIRSDGRRTIDFLAGTQVVNAEEIKRTTEPYENIKTANL